MRGSRGFPSAGDDGHADQLDQRLGVEQRAHLDQGHRGVVPPQVTPPHFTDRGEVVSVRRGVDRRSRREWPRAGQPGRCGVMRRVAGGRRPVQRPGRRSVGEGSGPALARAGTWQDEGGSLSGRGGPAAADRQHQAHRNQDECDGNDDEHSPRIRISFSVRRSGQP